MLLDDEDIEAIAERVAAKLRHGATVAAAYGDAQAVAARFALSRARLRFDLAEVERRLLANGRPQEPVAKPRRGRPRKRWSRSIELIPFDP